VCKAVFRDFAKELTEEIILEAKEKGYSIEDLAELIGVSKYSISNYIYDDKVPSLSVFIGLWRKTKPIKALKTLASWSNCAVIPLPEVEKESHLTILSKKTAMSLKEFSEFIDEIGNSLADNKITKQEAEKIKKEGMEAVEKILEIIKTTEEMAK